MTDEHQLDVHVNLESQDFQNKPNYHTSNSSIDTNNPNNNTNLKSENDGLKIFKTKYSLPDPTTQPKTDKPKPLPLISWEYWQTFTNIDQTQFSERILSSLNPIKPLFQIVVGSYSLFF